MPECIKRGSTGKVTVRMTLLNVIHTAMNILIRHDVHAEYCSESRAVIVRVCQVRPQVAQNMHSLRLSDVGVGVGNGVVG